jgi:hypothetical protein
MAVRGIVKLFRLMKHKKELHQEILAFLVSYNHQTVRIYSYYPMINKNKTTFYHYLIYKFSFIALNSKEK